MPCPRVQCRNRMPPRRVRGVLAGRPHGRRCRAARHPPPPLLVRPKRHREEEGSPQKVGGSRARHSRWGGEQSSPQEVGGGEQGLPQKVGGWRVGLAAGGGGGSKAHYTRWGEEQGSPQKVGGEQRSPQIIVGRRGSSTGGGGRVRHRKSKGNGDSTSGGWEDPVQITGGGLATECGSREPEDMLMWRFYYPRYMSI